MQSDYSLGKTGFGRNARAILSYLYPKDKYDILHYCCGLNKSHPLLSMTPWKSVGTLPDSPQILQELRKNDAIYKMASYGKDNLDETVRNFRPDVYIAIQDAWGVDFAVDKDWFDKASSVIWTTLDSLPILPSAVEMAPKIKNYWVWSSFAEKALHELGHTHVKTLHGAVESKYFYRMSGHGGVPIPKNVLKAERGLDPETFVAGFVFRNQLRKSVPNLLQGFRLFKEQDLAARAKCKLLLHTSFGEGWNIMKLASEHGVNAEDILATYVCHVCKSYRIANFEGEKKHCLVCGNKSSMTTPTVEVGVQEFQLNEIYNLMDVYIHPFTSGGQEVPIQEAKMTELITLVTSYSCGEEMCQKDAYSLSLDWSEYREHNTEFRKASTEPESIAERLTEVFEMTDQERTDLGKKAREWAVENFSTEKVGGFIEDFIDDAPLVDESIYLSQTKQDPDAKIDSSLSDSKWLQSLYENILDRKVNNNYDGYKYWMQELEKSEKLPAQAKEKQKTEIDMFFRRTAKTNLEKDIEYFLDDNDKGRRILFVLPQAAAEIFLGTSLFASAKNLYPNYNIYVSSDKAYQSMFYLNPHVHKFIPYNENMENVFFLEGNASHEGYFDLAFLPFSAAHNAPFFRHNGKDKLDFKTKV